MLFFACCANRRLLDVTSLQRQGSSALCSQIRFCLAIVDFKHWRRAAALPNRTIYTHRSTEDDEDHIMTLETQPGMARLGTLVTPHSPIL